VLGRAFRILAPALLVSARLQAGPLFDDYLNPVRPGPGTGAGNISVSTSSAGGIGQTFALAPNTAEVYRIGVRPIYQSWGPEERVTLTLYDSPRKTTKLAEYQIDAATSRVQPYVLGDGSHFKQTDDRVLFFQLRARTQGRAELYFELTSSGGDGQVAFQAFAEDVYSSGEAHGAGSAKDLSFECHIKPVADREANLRKFFGERLDLTRPELAAVKKAVDAGDWEEAIAQTVKHFHERMDLWKDWRDVMEVKPDPKADTSKADLLMKGMVRHADTGKPIPWRKESWWAPEIPDAKMPNDGIDPSPYLWHFDRELAAAYTVTGRADYARAAIDLRIQWILDNPNPKLIYDTPEFPYHHELWNDRTAAARTPGHGDLVYARLYNFPGWTNDEKLVFFSFIEDNARWIYRCTSGGNWLATAAKSALDFGIAFPGWKISGPCKDWGASALVDVSADDVRGDGTCAEGAIKYHAMVARRLLGLLKYHVDGVVRLDGASYERLVQVLNGMYDHMAYTLQPDSYVVMCGDSWYENYTDELRGAGELLKRPELVWIATQGKAGTPPTQPSRVYPEGGYFIMRSDFGGSSARFTDARQLFIHNGGWFGSHGHWDLTCLNLYAYGRTLIIDPGQYDYKPPQGIDTYWSSRIHSMLVCEDRDVKREPGPSRWMSNSVIDWFDGRHYGYGYLGNVDYVRRRVAFIRPEYFLVDDSAKTTRNTNWAQVWNLTDPNAVFDSQAGSLRTTFDEGGNVVILNQDHASMSVQRAPGITAAEKYPQTSIFRLTRSTDNPRFRTLVYPYSGKNAPKIEWQRIQPDDSGLSDLFYSVRVTTDAGIDWAVFGEPGRRVSYRKNKHAADAAFAVVRLSGNGKTRSFAWVDGRQLVFNGMLLAEARERVYGLCAAYTGQTLSVEARESDSTLRIRAFGAKRFVLNGKPVSKPVLRGGYFLPFAEAPPTVTADDLTGFERITKTNEWTFVPDPAAWSGGYTHHETDPGRHETGEYVLRVAAAGNYAVEVFLPKTTVRPSDRVEYRVNAEAAQTAETSGAIVGIRKEDRGCFFTLDQSAAAGWVRLGEFHLEPGEFRIRAKNVTETDGLYLIADAVRLVRTSY